MKILHVTEAIKGGVASYLEEIVEFQRLQADVENVTFFLPKGWDSQISNLRTQEVMEFDPVERKRVTSWAKYYLALRRALTATDPDVIHLHSTFPGIVGRPLLKLLGFKGIVIYQPHGWSFEMEVAKPLKWIYLGLERLLQTWCDKIICLTHYEYERISSKNFEHGKLTVIRTGLKEDVSHPVSGADPEGPLNLLFVGRLDRQKGVDLLLRAMAEIKRKDITLKIIGAPVKGGEGLELPRNVDLLGWLPRSEINAHFAMSDAVVMPSRWEGLPLVALEAFRASTPVIANSIGPMSEIVSSDMSGFVIDFDDLTRTVTFFESLDKRALHLLRPNCRRWFERHFRSIDMNKMIMKMYRDELRRVAQKIDDVFSSLDHR